MAGMTIKVLPDSPLLEHWENRAVQCGQCRFFTERTSMVEDWGHCTNKCPSGICVMKHRKSIGCDDFSERGE